MKRNTSPRWCAAVTALLICLLMISPEGIVIAKSPAEKEQKRPNILFIIMDDIGID